jgi:peptide chain release factor 1
MEPLMRRKLLDLVAEHERLGERMADPEVASKPQVFREAARSHAELSPTVARFRAYVRDEEHLAGTISVLEGETDPEWCALAREDQARLESALAEHEEALKLLLIPKDPNDSKNTILEIRAGTGGDEAALFCADLYRAYTRFAERKGWKVEVLSLHETGLGGFKEVIFKLNGENVYSQMKYEGGVHRVQRVPKTEAQGRIHTSAVTVAVLPEAEDVEVKIEEKDLQFDVYRSSGPGGQSVNTTDSAVRVTHKPSGLVVTCQDEKSQHKNKAKALLILKARLFAQMQAEESAKRSANRKNQVGSGDRSERIRTYNFPQNRVTDHRINLTVYRLEQVMDGDFQDVIDPLIAADRAARLAEA